MFLVMEYFDKDETAHFSRCGWWKVRGNKVPMQMPIYTSAHTYKYLTYDLHKYDGFHFQETYTTF